MTQIKRMDADFFYSLLEKQTQISKSTKLCEPCDFSFACLAVKTNNLIGTRITQIKRMDADFFIYY